MEEETREILNLVLNTEMGKENFFTIAEECFKVKEQIKDTESKVFLTNEELAD